MTAAHKNAFITPYCVLAKNAVELKEIESIFFLDHTYFFFISHGRMHPNRIKWVRFPIFLNDGCVCVWMVFLQPADLSPPPDGLFVWMCVCERVSVCNAPARVVFKCNRGRKEAETAIKQAKAAARFGKSFPLFFFGSKTPFEAWKKKKKTFDRTYVMKCFVVDVHFAEKIRSSAVVPVGNNRLFLFVPDFLHNIKLEGGKGSQGIDRNVAP